MIYNHNFMIFREALKAAEDLSKITNSNIANAETLGYKKLIGKISPTTCCEDCHDEDMLFEGLLTNLKLNITRDQTPGKQIDINGQMTEGSNVDATEEMKKLVNISNMTRSILTSMQLDNRLQQEILNLGR